MKLLIAIVQDDDSAALSDELVKQGIRTTKLATTGGFLRSGNTTFLMGVDDDRVDDALAAIKETSHTRKQYVSSPPVNLSIDPTMSEPVEVQVGGATVFILPIEKFLRF